MDAKLVYRSDDRSLLLPAYRRFVVDPLVPLIPASVSPNAITHAGHLVNLLGVALLVTTWPARGWPFVAAAALLQLYILCDNADGAHARRTGRTSPLGELYDHGLDILNVIYMGYLSALALGASPLEWVLIVTFVAGAGSVTYWEQAETGVFRLGAINQIESGLVLSGSLLVSASLGVSTWGDLAWRGVSARTAMVAWLGGTVVFGVARATYRVSKQRGLSAAWALTALVFASVAVLLSAGVGALSTVAAVTILSAMHASFAMRMLLVRLRRGHGQAADAGGVGPWLALAGALAACAAVIQPGRSPAEVSLAGALFATFTVIVFGVQSLIDVRTAAGLVARPTPAR